MKRILLVALFSLVLILAVSVPAMAAPNLVVNGDFESGDTGFSLGIGGCERIEKPRTWPGGSGYH